MRISDWSSDVCSSDLFGTRYTVVATVFLNHLIDLCGSEWDEENQIWVPDDGELNAILHIVAAQKPQNEAQAALAAQTAATHILTMKVAKRVADYPHDTRMIAAYAKLARASATQFRSEEHTSALQSLMRISYAVFCLKKKTNT